MVWKIETKIQRFIFRIKHKKIDDINTSKRETKTQELIRRFKYNKSALFGLILILILVFMAIFADFIAPNDPNPSPPELENSLKPGFWEKNG